MGILYFSGMKPLDLKVINRNVWFYQLGAVALVLVILITLIQFQPKSVLDFTLFYLLIISIVYIIHQFQAGQQDMLWGEGYRLPERSKFWINLIATIFSICSSYFFIMYDFEWFSNYFLYSLVPILIINGMRWFFKTRLYQNVDILWQENRLYVESSMGFWEEIALPCTFKFYSSNLEIKDANQKQILVSSVRPQGDKLTELLTFLEDKPITLLSTENYE